ncbi:MAG: UDP-N-acetylglucosamine 2-epimerase (non-hydrolyzing) [Proteobacteria bacterium]|nr:UDP-N-acetylglucosamine 2-epimerase (non-hydrolyzing) [Pseudomonadota bacterium]
MTIRVLTIIGTRPEAIKMAPLVLALQNDERFESAVCATGQHREMLYQVLDWFKITPDYALNVMTHNQPLAYLSGRVLNGLQTIISGYKPDMVLVHGDTTSGFIGALAAFYNRVPVAHIEAGLRTGDLYAPYPEEANRQLISRLAQWHFAPTQTAADSLMCEDVPNPNIFVTGNTVIDALLETTTMLAKKPIKVLPEVPEDARMILVTGHRRENYGDGFVQICEALKHIATTYPDTHVVYPVHLNPNVKNVVHEMLDGIGNVHLVAPMDYPSFVAAMQRSTLILTDSGGIQEEAPSLGKPVLVMREVTERPDAVAAGTVKLVGAKKERIIAAVSELLDNPDVYARMSQAKNPYGDGKATRRILNILAGEEVATNTFDAGITTAA